MLLFPCMDEGLYLSRLCIVMILLRVPVLTTLTLEKALSTLIIVMSNLAKRRILVTWKIKLRTARRFILD